MQYLGITKSTTLSDLSDRVGKSALNELLHINGADRVPNIGAVYLRKCEEDANSDTHPVTGARKISVLSTMTSDTDIFQTAALMGEYGWKLLSSKNILPNTLKIPDTIKIPSADDVLGDGVPVQQDIFDKVAKSITQTNRVDPSIFNNISFSIGATNTLISGVVTTDKEVMNWFHIPWGEVTLHSSIDDSRIDFPVYPEEISDARKADYTTMPDTLYQYEPWQIYTSSGPRSNTYTFHFHRDMWTGDHRDGNANKLIRACMANLYPEYQGSAVNTSIVTLYIHGSALIRGILTDVSVDWSGPLGLDNFYLECKLSLSITEVSSEALNFTVMKNKPLIG